MSNFKAKQTERPNRMKNNILIGVLSAISVLSLYRLHVERKERAQIALIPDVKVVDWPYELAPSILDDSTFTATLRFKMNGPYALVVDFVPTDDSLTSK